MYVKNRNSNSGINENGFWIIHFGQIVIHPETIIGKNFNISQGVTLGHAGGAKVASPKIINNVSIGPNAVAVGGVVIGDDVLIAPNAFVNFDVPNGAIILGIQGKLSKKKRGVLNTLFIVD